MIWTFCLDSLIYIRKCSNVNVTNNLKTTGYLSSNDTKRKTLNIEIEIYLCVSEWMSYWNTAPCGFISHQYCNFFFVVCLCPLKTFTENLICVYSKCDDSHGRAKTTTEMHKILSSCHVLLLYFPDILYVPSTTIYVTNMAKVTHNST